MGINSCNWEWIHLYHTHMAVAFARWNFFTVLQLKDSAKFQQANATAIRVC